MRRVSLVSLMALMACGGNPATPATPTSAEVDIHGTITRLSGGRCGPSLAADDIYLGNKQLTFRDGANVVIGTTTTDAGTLTERVAGQPASGCTISATYDVQLPRTDFYQVTLEGDVPLVQAAPISYADLQAQGFAYDLQVDNA